MAQAQASPHWQTVKARAEVFEGLRRDAAEQGQQEASIAYGWAALRLMNEAVALRLSDVRRSLFTRPPEA